MAHVAQANTEQTKIEQKRLRSELKAAQEQLHNVYTEVERAASSASSLKIAAKQNPELLEDSWVDARIKWLDLFDREISAVETVNQAAEAGKLSLDEIRAGRQTGEKLLEILSRARERTLQPA